MSILVDTLGDSSVIHLQGHIDAATAPGLEKEVLSALDSVTGSFILDMANVGYISSAGLRFFLIISKWSMSKKISFCLTEVNETVMNIFKISGFGRLMKFQPTLNDALLSQKKD